MKPLFTFLLLVFASRLLAQQVTFTYSKQKILIGEPVQVKVQATIKSGEAAPFFIMDSLPHFEVLDRSKIDTIKRSGLLQLSQTLIFTSWDSGRWALPSSITNTVFAKPINIDVGYTTPWNPKQPYNDIKDIILVQHPGKSSWWWYVIGAAVLLALILLLFPQGKNEKAATQLDSNAYKKAMQQLDKLQKEGTLSTNIKQYYTELITIFRIYLKTGKGIQSFSKTTGDLALQLQTIKMPGDEYNQLLQTLRLSDLVKFAQYGPAGNINRDAFNTIKQTITTIEQRHVV